MKKVELYLLVLMLVGGLAVRLYKINNPVADWHSWRQADTASVSRTYVQQGINLLYPRYHDVSSIQTGINNPSGFRFVEFPVYNAVHAVLAKSFPSLTFEVWGRLVSIFSALISAVILYLLGKRFIGRLGGLLAAFFFLFIPYNVYFTRVILPEPMATTFALAALLLFVNFIDKDKLKDLLLSGVFLSLALLVKPFTIFYTAPMLYLVSEKHGLTRIVKNGRLLIKFLLFADISLVPLLLWRGWMSNYPLGIPFYTWAFNGDGIRFRPAFWRWIFGERLGKLILGVWGVVPFSLGLAKVQKKTIFILMFLLGMFVYVATIATANVRHDYYQIFIIPAVALALAQGANFLLTSKELNRTISILVLGFSVGMMLFMGAYQVKEYYKVNHPEIIEVGREIDRITPKDALIVAPYNGDTAFLYQANRWGWPAIDNSLDNLIERGADYYVSVTPQDADTQTIIKKYKTIKQTDKYIIVDLHQRI